MSEESEQKPTIEAEATPTEVEKTPTAKTPKKKSRFPFYLFLILLMAAGSWAFWNYSPFITSFKDQWLNKFNHTFANNPTEPTVAVDVPSIITPAPDQQEPVPEEVEQDEQPVQIESITDSPTFEPAITLEQVSAQVLAASNDLQAKNIEELRTAMQTSMQAMEEQVLLVQQNMRLMQEQQLKQAQQYVRAQLFTALQQAASTSTTLSSKQAAWKNISFMPLIHEEKRQFAEDAFRALKTVETDKLQATEEISTWISTLSAQMRPAEREVVAEVVAEDITTAPEPLSLDAIITWFKQQFMFSKVGEHTVHLGHDPYVKIKQFIEQLDTLKTSLKAEFLDDNIQAGLENIFHQLDQYGIETSLSVETILGFEDIQQSWIDEAHAWMEQL